MPAGYAVMERAPALSADPFGGLLDPHQAARLREALAGRLVALCFGAGVDSTAMLVALHAAGLRPDLITFADTGAEKSATLRHIERLAPILAAWGWPPINNVTGDGLAVRRRLADRRRFIVAADAGRGDDNALDSRALKG